MRLWYQGKAIKIEEKFMAFTINTKLLKAGFGCEVCRVGKGKKNIKNLF